MATMVRSLRLISADEGFQLWSKEFDGELPETESVANGKSDRSGVDAG
jgi:hypothetical protein